LLGTGVGDAGAVQGAEQPVPEVARVSCGRNADDDGFQPAVLVIAQVRGNSLDQAGGGPRRGVGAHELPGAEHWH